MINPFLNAQKQLEEVGQIMNLASDKLEILKNPQSILEVNIPVKMDNGEVKLFKGFRSQHNNALGPYKGGIRFHPGVTKEEVMALSMWMSWKCSVAGIPFGGGKGGVIVDPKSLSEAELEQLSRGYVKAAANVIGANLDVPAPDVGTNGKVMALMQDEYSKIKCSAGTICKNNEIMASFTGKPVNSGGSLGREQATGRGGVFILEELTKKLGRENKDLKIAVQGIGNVGYWFAKLAQQAGFKIIAISDSKGGVKGELSDIEKIKEFKEETGSVLGFPNTEKISNEELLELEVDILVPAALENVITVKNADKIKTKIIMEMANGPITPEADEILNKKGILVVPDILANCGGVTVSFFEWDQNMKEEKWDEETINKKLKKIVTDSFAQIWQIAQEKKLSLRLAAYVLAIDKITSRM